MAYLASKLITRAWYLSSIVPRGLNVVSGDKMSDGLQLLNELLAIKTADSRLIPYFKQYNFTAVTGQEKYFVENLLMVETFTFNIGTVRYTLQETSRRNYFGSPRANNIQSLPFEWRAERTKGGTDLYLYFLPNTTYPLTIWGKFGLDEVASENEDLSLVYDNFYIAYLRYALAEYMCEEYNIPFQPGPSQKLQEYEQMLMDISPPDLSLDKVSTFTSDLYLNYADVNLGQAWRPR